MSPDTEPKIKHKNSQEVTSQERKSDKERKLRIFFWSLLSLVLFLIALVLALSYRKSTVEQFIGDPERKVTVISAGEDLKKETREIEDYAGVENICCFVQPEVPDEGAVLALWLVHAYATVEIDGQRVYSCRESDAWHIGHTPGCYWAYVPLKIEDAGKEVRVTSVPVYSSLAGRLPDIYMGEKTQVFSYFMEKEANTLLLAFLCVLTGLIFMLSVCFVKMEKQVAMQVLSMGLIVFLLGIWRLGDRPSFAMIFNDHAQLVTNVYLLALGLLAPATMLYAYWRSPSSLSFRIMWVVGMLVNLYILVAQFVGWSDIRDNLLLMHLTLVVCIVLVLVRLFLGMARGVLFEWQDYYLQVIAMGGVVDMVIYYYMANSLYLVVTMVLIFSWGLIYGVVSLRGALKQREYILRQEEEMQENRVMTMMSQIRPHFIYNTLNSIYHLCDRDPKTAQEAIHDFSGYLRGNFEAMEKKEPVDFREEMQHVRFYLSIEQLRFGEALQVKYDIQEENFLLPALTLQPLVENAVRHGIRGGSGEGTVTITTLRQGNMAVIRVQDDGVGFSREVMDILEGKDTVETDFFAPAQTTAKGGAGTDPRKDATIREQDGSSEKRMHLGLMNVRERIEKMCHGTLSVESTPGKGSVVTVTVPVRS